MGRLNVLNREKNTVYREKKCKENGRYWTQKKLKSAKQEYEEGRSLRSNCPLCTNSCSRKLLSVPTGITTEPDGFKLHEN